MPEYVDHPDVRERAVETARDCPDCTVRELSLIDGDATHYVFCDRHHRELYARYAERVAGGADGDRGAGGDGGTGADGTDAGDGTSTGGRRSAATDPEAAPDDGLTDAQASALSALGVREGVDVDAGEVTADVGRVVAALDGDGDNRSDALEALAAIATVDPEAAVPAVEPAIRAVSTEHGPGSTRLNVGWHVSTVLGDAALVDRPTLTLLVGSLGRPVDWLGTVVDAVATVAERDPDRLLTVGEPVERDGTTAPRAQRGGATVPRATAIDALAGLVTGDRAGLATRVLLPLARHRPAAVAPVADALRAGLGDDAAVTRFRTAAILGRAGAADPAVLRPAADALASLCAADAAVDRGAGAVALSYWPADGTPPVGRDRLRSALRELLDPAEYDDERILEATAALGSVGTEADLDLLTWIQLPTLPEAVHDAAERSIAAVRDREW